MDRESETENDDVVEIKQKVIEEQKKQKQSQITFFVRSQKKIFSTDANFWFVPYKSRDYFTKKDDFIPIGAFPIGAEDCITENKSFILVFNIGKSINLGDLEIRETRDEVVIKITSLNASRFVKMFFRQLVHHCLSSGRFFLRKMLALSEIKRISS